MQFNVSTLLKEPTGATRQYDIDDDLKVDGERQRLTGHVRFDRTHDGVLVRATLSGVAHDECSRCLRPITFDVPVQFEEEYIPVVDVVTGAHVEPPEGVDDAYRISERHMLDVGEAAEQYWRMALPMAPACQEECRERCPHCGALLVDAAHECAAMQADARWAKLRGLKLG
jgi:uncharacterized protein